MNSLFAVVENNVKTNIFFICIFKKYNRPNKYASRKLTRMENKFILYIYNCQDVYDYPDAGHTLDDYLDFITDFLMPNNHESSCRINEHTLTCLFGTMIHSKLLQNVYMSFPYAGEVATYFRNYDVLWKLYSSSADRTINSYVIINFEINSINIFGKII